MLLLITSLILVLLQLKIQINDTRIVKSTIANVFEKTYSRSLVAKDTQSFFQSKELQENSYQKILI